VKVLYYDSTILFLLERINLIDFELYMSNLSFVLIITALSYYENNGTIIQESLNKILTTYSNEIINIRTKISTSTPFRIVLARDSWQVHFLCFIISPLAISCPFVWILAIVISVLMRKVGTVVEAAFLEGVHS
jgi:hypothetical protein